MEEKKGTTREGAATPQCKCSRVSMLRDINQLHALISTSHRYHRIQIQVGPTASNANCDDESLTDRLCEDPSLHYRCEDSVH
jgi:hypothetical protein